MEKTVWSQEELAALCGVSTTAIRQRCMANKLERGEILIGKRRFYSADQVKRITAVYRSAARPRLGRPKKAK